MWELSERFTDKETSTTAGRRRALSEVTKSADEGVARWSAVYQFSGGSGRFYPGFRKAVKIRFVKVKHSFLVAQVVSHHRLKACSSPELTASPHSW